MPRIMLYPCIYLSEELCRLHLNALGEVLHRVNHIVVDTYAPLLLRWIAAQEVLQHSGYKCSANGYQQFGGKIVLFPCPNG